jgi:hypothetical protein
LSGETAGDCGGAVSACFVAVEHHDSLREALGQKVSLLAGHRAAHESDDIAVTCLVDFHRIEEVSLQNMPKALQ